MLSISTLKQNDDPHDVLVVAPDVALVVPTDAELSKLAHTLRHPSAPQIRTGSERPAGATIPPAGASAPPVGATVPPVDATFRPAVGDIRVPGPRRAARVFTTALLLAGCAASAAFAWQSYGDAAERLIAQWPPQRILASLLPLERPAASAQPTAPAAETVVANAAARQPAAPAEAAPQPVVPAEAAPQGVAPGTAGPSVEFGAVAACDGARPRQCGAGDRAAQGQHRAAQGQHRPAHGRPATNVPRHRQGFRAEPGAEDTAASTAAGRGPGAQAAATFATAGHAASDAADANRRALRTAATWTAAARPG